MMPQAAITTMAVQIIALAVFPLGIADIIIVSLAPNRPNPASGAVVAYLRHGASVYLTDRQAAFDHWLTLSIIVLVPLWFLLIFYTVIRERLFPETDERHLVQ